MVSEIVGMDALQDAGSSAFGPMCRPANLALEREREEKTNYQYVVYCLKQVLQILRASGIVVLCFEKAPADRSQVAKSLSVGPSMLRFFGTAVTVRTRP